MFNECKSLLMAVRRRVEKFLDGRESLSRQINPSLEDLDFETNQLNQEYEQHALILQKYR